MATDMSAPTNANMADRKIDKLADNAHGVVQDGQSSLADAAKRAEKVVHEGLDTLRAQTRAYTDTAAEKVDVAQRYVVEHVKERPLSATLGALAVGVVLGLLLAGGRRH